MKRRLLRALPGSLIILVLVTACGGQSDADLRSIEEIHAEEGVPVNVREIGTTRFTAAYSYTSSLSGAEESSASAMIADEIDQVHVAVGDYVEKDQVIISFPTDNAALNYEQARVNFESARTSFQRISKLYADEGVSQQSLDNARTQYEIAKANWDTVQNMKDVRAPFSGYVTRINVFESDNVNPGDPLFTVSDMERLKSTVWVTDRQVENISVGQRATAEWRGHLLEGQVIQVDMAMDQERKAFAVKLEFDNSTQQVRSGVTANIGIEVYRNDEAVVLDLSEIISAGSENYVFVTDGAQSLRRPINLGRQEGLMVEVLAGLEAGELLITDGISLIEDGTKIRIIENDESLAAR